MRTLVFGVVFFLLLASFSDVFAHDHGDEDNVFSDALLRARAQTLTLAFDSIELGPDTFSGPEAIARIGSSDVYLNSPFLKLMRLQIREIHRELKKECDECEFPDVEELIGVAQDIAGQTFFRKQLVEPMSEGLENIIVEAADLGARLGVTAIQMKVAVEGAETVASFSVGGKGFHLLCSIFDAVIFFWTRHLQIAGRLPFQMARPLGASSLGQSYRWLSIQRAISRATHQVQFDLDPIIIDQEGIELVLNEGPSRSRWFGLIRQNTRKRWFDYLESSHQKLKTNLQALRNKQQLAPLSIREEQKLLQLERKLRRYSQLNKDRFFGSRKYFFLLSGKSSNSYMASNDDLDHMLKKSHFLWILSPQERILHAGLIDESYPQGHRDPRLRNHIANYTIDKPADPITFGLIEEFSQQHEFAQQAHLKVWLEALLGQIEQIFNPNIPKAVRYALTLQIEDFIATMLYSSNKEAMDKALFEDLGYWGRLWHQFWFRYRGGYFTFISHRWTDFLRGASLANNTVELYRHRHEAMEFLLRLWTHQHHLDVIYQARSPLAEKNKALKRLNDFLESYHPWRPKNLHFSWRPFFLPKSLPRCEAIAKK